MKITKPTLLLDKQKCRKNIKQMTEKAKRNDLIFRPHFKTHQSRQIAEWFKEFGVEKITVSSVEMAKYFSNSGWKDITIAFPFNQLEITEINELAEKIDLKILLIHPESVDFLNKNLTQKIGVFIELDCDYHRSGIPIENLEEIDFLISAIVKVKKLKLEGFLTHSGQTYQTKSTSQILQIHQEVKSKMIKLKEKYSSQFPDLKTSIGDTPSCSLADNFSGIDEIRPGNFVFFDVMQYKLGACKAKHIAVSVACPIVSKNEQRKEVVIYGGAVHLSKEFILNEDGTRNFGLIVKLTENGWSEPIEGAYVSSLSQEHGIAKVSKENYNDFKIGDVVGILPIHSCLTANLMGKYITLEGEEIHHM
ncbi:MAG: alanine racemase [Candidatus Cloacimonetes bacterium]|nr:alanine racemase [Candidatus Cloacimonadota bacterium]MCF7813350.1 alanine racemase [Candidatus Cloacimonadota bacterium]MCF7867839.1 alanine racemase [Candidatus Cloacimonadota bacterium]MCF7883275.1 alanine racemase [Candidatus Cloacimonadota bacterium]